MANLLRFDFNDRDGIFEMVENGDWVRATDYDALAAKLAEVKASSQGWLDEAVKQQVRRKKAEERILEVEAERDGWIETARMHHDAEAAFLKWLRAAGEHMRAEGVTVCDDGSDSGGILAAKVPACAALLQARAEAAEARIAHLENHIEGVAKDTHKIMVDLATPLDDPRVEALVDLIKRAEHNVPEYYTLWHADARAALEAIASPSIATPLNDPRVKALVEALKEAERMLKHYGSRDAGGMAQIRAALSALEENK